MTRPSSVRFCSALRLARVLALGCGALAACGTSPSEGEDADSESAAVTLPAGNLVANPSFESNLDGWYGWNSSLSRKSRSDAPNGHYVAKVTRASGTMYSTGDSNELVKSIPSGASYSAVAYVRAASSSASGKPITLILRERTASGQNAKLWSSQTAHLGSSFVALKVTASAPTKGNQLDVYVLQEDAVSGDAFYVDAVSVVASGGSSSTSSGASSSASSSASSGTGGSGGAGGSGGSGGGAPAPTGPSGTWTLAFADEFSGTSLDGSKWNSGWYTSGVNASSPPVQSSELEFYGPGGIVFPGDGSVHLRLSASSSNSYGKSYQSGMIQSSNRFTFNPKQSPTVIEARIKVPGPNAHAAGYWPAFWILSNLDAAGGTGQWPPEFDIFEFFSTSNKPVAHLHTTGGDINLGFSDSDGATDLSLAFHVYTFEMSTSALTFYLDGAQKWQYTNTQYIANLFAYAPMYVLFNLGFGGAGGSPNGQSTVPADMAIDYVRAWTQ